MLLRLNSIEEIGRFRALTHKAEQFSPLSLVFARNAYGKSTLCAVLRSASENDPKLINARRRLAATGESRVQTTWDPSTTVAFGGGKWNATSKKVHVFDQEYVSQNLHVGESVTRENKRSLLPVVLGEEGVRLSEKILALDQEQRELDATMKSQSAIIRTKCPSVSDKTLSSFCSRLIPTDNEKRLEAAAKAVELAKHSLAVRQKLPPAPIKIESRAHHKELAARTIETVTADAAQRVKEHVDKHGLSPNGERWLRYGVEHSTSDTCPFCDQNIRGLDLVTVFQAYFSDAFEKLIQDRDAALKALDTTLSELDSLLEDNEADLTFWQTVTELPAVETITAEQRTAIKDGLKAIQKTLLRKVEDPLAVLDFGDADSEVQEGMALIERYNSAIAKCVAAIEQTKKDVQNADLKQAEVVFQAHQDLSMKASDPVKTAAEQYAVAELRRAAIESEKKQAQADLTNYAKKTIGERQSDVNQLLALFGANFKVVDAKANFVGREPNTEFAIEVGARKVKVGEKSDVEPSFKTVLSAGDKMTLALAFFISQVRADPRLADAVVAFDDPFNSQDLNRQFETTSQIRAIAKLASQTIVFSHDPRFLHMIEKDADKAAVKTFQILCSDDGRGTISPWSSEEELKQQYVRQSESIREFASKGVPLPSESLTTVLQGMRPFLEDYMRARFPGRFAEGVMLNAMITEIQSTGDSDPMFTAVADLTALNEYTRPSMHGGGPNPDPTSLRAQCQRIVDLVGRY